MRALLVQVRPTRDREIRVQPVRPWARPASEPKSQRILLDQIVARQGAGLHGLMNVRDGSFQQMKGAIIRAVGDGAKQEGEQE
jgi:hypothetical protein